MSKNIRKHLLLHIIFCTELHYWVEVQMLGVSDLRTDGPTDISKFHNSQIESPCSSYLDSFYSTTPVFFSYKCSRNANLYPKWIYDFLVAQSKYYAGFKWHFIIISIIKRDMDLNSNIFFSLQDLVIPNGV